MISIAEAKRMARQFSSSGLLSHGHALEAVARAAGFRDWNTFVATAEAAVGPVGPQRVVPILRMFDHRLAKTFYCDFLGFTWQWQHQFEPDLPVYEVEWYGSVLHLLEHDGDATPGGAVMILVDDIDKYQNELLEKHYRNARPRIDANPWGRTMSVTDPFGNRITFWQR